MQRIWIILLLVMLVAGCASPTAPVSPTPTILILLPTGTSTSPPANPTLIPTSTPLALTPTPLPPGQEAILDVSLENAIDLTGKWRFSQVKTFNVDMTGPAFDDSQWSEVDAPTSWVDQGMADQVGKGTVVIYRRQVDVPIEWKGQPIGIYAWFNPFVSQVFVNGERVEPVRQPFAPYADISALLHYGESNTIAVVTQYDGFLEFAESGPARLGPLVKRPVTQLVHEEVTFDTPNGKAEATIIRAAEKKNLPGLVLVATGSHGLAEKVTWYDLADDLARLGYVSMAVALPQQKPEGVLAAVKLLTTNPAVNPGRIVLFGVDQASEAVVQAAVQDNSLVGVILLSPPQVISAVSGLGNRPLLMMASRSDRNGLILEQLQEMAKRVTGPVTVQSLPGDGHGTFIITNTWNPLRQALMAWLNENTH